MGTEKDVWAGQGEGGVMGQGRDGEEGGKVGGKGEKVGGGRGEE